jgi:hypothetical protein
VKPPRNRAATSILLLLPVRDPRAPLPLLALLLLLLVLLLLLPLLAGRSGNAAIDSDRCGARSASAAAQNNTNAQITRMVERWKVEGGR